MGEHGYDVGRVCMKKSWFIIAAGLLLLVLILFLVLHKKTFTIGKDPKIEEISSVSVGGGGMSYDSSWNWSASHSTSKGTYKLYRRMWDEKDNAYSEGEMQITYDEYMRIVQTLTGLKYAPYDPPKNVMDDYSESSRIFWPDSPSGSYRIEFGEGGMKDLLQAFNEVWNANKEKAVYK